MSNNPAGVPRLRTRRLVLREWRDSDRPPFAAMNADPVVMRHFPTLLLTRGSDQLVDRICQHFSTHGFGLWAVEIPGVTPFAGFIGLAVPRFDAAFTPCIEIGWRLAAEFHGHGIATEGATAAMEFGLERFDEILSFTIPDNVASRRVMEKLGMTHNPADDFNHPLVPPDHPMQRHVLYRMTRTRWTGRQP